MKGDHRDLSDETIRVLVADSSRIHTRLLADELRRDGTLSVLPSESDSSGLVAAVMAQDVDVLVISATLDEHPSHGIEILRELRTLRPATKAVVLLDSSKDEAVVQAFRAGARAVFGRNDPIEMLSGCVRCVHQGQI
jgi:two-component system, NarL family, nitrate/nitrite response regulator NarL